MAKSSTPVVDLTEDAAAGNAGGDSEDNESQNSTASTCSLLQPKRRRMTDETVRTCMLLRSWLQAKDIKEYLEYRSSLLLDQMTDFS